MQPFSAALYAMLRALGIAAAPTPPQPRWWLAAGSPGSPCSSKYNAALVLAGAALAMLSDPVSRRELRRFAPWGAAILAVAMFLPVIWWNAHHGWRSFDYQGGRATGVRLHPLAPLTIWGGEALFLLPGSGCRWCACSRRAAARPGGAARLAAQPARPAAGGVSSVVGIWSATKILYHWATPGYLMLLPLCWETGRKIFGRVCANIVAALSGVLLAFAALFIAAEATLNFIPGSQSYSSPPGKSPLLQILDWDTTNFRMPRDTQAVAALRCADVRRVAKGVPILFNAATAEERSRGTRRRR